MSSVGSVGAGAPVFSSIDDSCGSAAISLSGELAVLLLETQEQRKAIDHERLSSARADFRDALDDEVQALKDAADATRRGAMLQAGLSVAGCATSMVGLLMENEVVAKGGDGLSSLAKPMGEWVGVSYGTANAQAAEGEQQAAKWEIDDTREAISSAKELQNKALDWASSIIDRDAATTAAILANKA